MFGAIYIKCQLPLSATDDIDYNDDNDDIDYIEDQGSLSLKILDLIIRFAHRYHTYMFLYEKLQVSFS
jgi:hypothetical protein